MAKLRNIVDGRRPGDGEGITAKELEEVVKNTDWSHIFEEAARKARPEMEAYRRARAKSKATACCTVFY